MKPRNPRGNRFRTLNRCMFFNKSRMSNRPILKDKPRTGRTSRTSPDLKRNSSKLSKKLTPETGNQPPRSPTPPTGEEAVALSRRNRSTSPRALIQPPSSYSKNCRRLTASSACRATASTTWKGGDDIAHLSGDAIARVPTPLRGHLRGETGNAARPGPVPPRGEIDASGLIPVLPLERLGRIRNLKPLKTGVSPPRRKPEDPPKPRRKSAGILRKTTANPRAKHAISPSEGNIQTPLGPVTRKISAAPCPSKSDASVSPGEWKNRQPWITMTGPPTPMIT